MLSKAFNSAAEKALPSVVKILARTSAGGSDNGILSQLSGSDQQRFDSVGSGVIISSDGAILTNHHVIKDSIRTEVRLSDGRRYTVNETLSDAKNDVAIIKIDPDEDLPVASLGKAEELYIGEWVLAIGSPFMLDSSVSAGIVSATRRYRTLSPTVNGQFLQTDAAINPGNSGGPLINLEGAVIGINTAISTTSGSFQGIGFAIPIERASWIVNELQEHGEVRRGYAGVSTARVPYKLAKQLELPQAGGALVANVVPGRPAEKSGLKPGDVIVAFDGEQIRQNDDFAALVQQATFETPIKMTVIRGGERVDLEIQIQERPQ